MYKFALIGYPVSQSLSQVIHRAALNSLGLEGDYELLPTPLEDLVDRIKYLKANDYDGVNVTIPIKVPVTLFLDSFDKVADVAGSANTLKFTEDRSMVGYNTDVYGFYQAIPNKIRTELQGKKVAVLGAGGAARAIVVALVQLNISSIDFYVRNILNARDCVENIRKYCPSLEVNLKQMESMNDLSKYSMLVNTTPVGMINKSMGISPVDEKVLNTLNDDAIVYDIVYNPIKTELLRLAQKRGIRTISGLDMLVYQAQKSFEIWTGKLPDFKDMKIAALEALLDK
ncbi:shikimate dehydrogenase [bacterium]|nr:shikimate dehydrogenase [bacterium]